MRKSEVTAAIGYIRVSTDEQHLGPEAQRSALATWCRSNSVELVATFEDLGLSGGLELDKRPGLLAAIDAVRAHRGAALLVAKRDRLARDVIVAGMVGRLVERHGGRIISADGTGNGDGPEAQLMGHIINAFAEYERALIRARTRNALAIKRTRAERVGGVPFGHQLAADGLHLEENAGEQAVLAQVRRLRGEGLSLRAIAARLNARRVPARGRRWHLTTVARLLNREAA